MVGRDLEQLRGMLETVYLVEHDALVSVVGKKGLRGRIEYPRWLSLRLSAVEILGFAVLFLVAFLISGSWFFIGGAISCLLTGVKHRDWAAKADLETAHVTESSPGDAE